MAFLSCEHRLWSSVGGQRREVERLRLARSFGGDVKSCLADRCYALSCMVDRCYARQIFQRLQAVSAGGTWRHGAEVYRRRPRRAQQFARRVVVPLGAVVTLTADRPGKDDASVQL
ncbi:Arginyl-tRNA synthetase [Hordeum vulgare]|nr:Arginyl-tRNA synthetase [Hordeum vulgare]